MVEIARNLVLSVKCKMAEKSSLSVRNTWSLNLRAIENCICSIRSIERKMKHIFCGQYIYSQS
jgi:hypothetical protein